MKNKIHILIILFISISITSCYNYRSVGLLQDKNATLPKYEKADYENYKIQVNDEIIYRLMTIDETISKLIAPGVSGLNTISYRVYPDGTIDLPFVKGVQIVGLTLKEAAKVLENRFKEIIPDATVKLSLANKTFTIIGEAGTGVYAISRERLTIYQALSMSGEFNHSGDFKHVRILRAGEKGLEELTFDIRPISVIESKYYYIYPNDIIYVQRDPSSFYKIENSWGTFIGAVSSSISLLYTIIYYGNQ